MVALVDSGSYPHPDLRRNLLKGIDLISGRGGDGQNDENGHGTRMASLIAAHGHKRNGVQGIAPAAKILPVRVSEKENGISVTAMAEGVTWATGHGAKVINVSIAAGPAFELQDAVNSAIRKGIVVVAAVGNTTKGNSIASYPAAFDGVLAVGAIGRDGEHASISVKDAKVQLCAPGVDLTSAQPKDRYATASGTSGATALVSGAAALVRAKFPHLSGEDVIHRLTATADDIGPPGRDDECGFGRLNVLKALTADVPPLEGATSSTATPAATTPAAADSTSPVTAIAPRGESRNGSSATVVLGGLGGVAVALGVLAFFSLRRRRNF